MSRNLVRTLCLRESGARYSFALRFLPETELSVRRLDKSPTGDAQSTSKSEGIQGIIIVDDNNKLVFISANDPSRVLNAVAAWARSEDATLAGAGIVMNAGAARWEGDTADRAAVAAVDLSQLSILRDDRHWVGLVRPGPGHLADVLQRCLPGERLWYWLTDQPGKLAMPLLLQGVQDDPNREGLNALLDAVEANVPGPAATGLAYATEEGVFQFIGGDLKATHLRALADWVRAHVSQHPALARLSGCQLAVTANGKVQEVISDDGLWSDLPRPAVPGTAAETDELLSNMQPGESFWFWATGSAPKGAFLSLAPIGADPEGTAFRDRVAGFLRRFPDSYADAFVGTVERTVGGPLRFQAARGAPEQWPGLVETLARIHPASAGVLEGSQLGVARVAGA